MKYSALHMINHKVWGSLQETAVSWLLSRDVIFTYKQNSEFHVFLFMDYLSAVNLTYRITSNVGETNVC